MCDVAEKGLDYYLEACEICLWNIASFQFVLYIHTHTDTPTALPIGPFCITTPALPVLLYTIWKTLCQSNLTLQPNKLTEAIWMNYTN